MSKKLTLFTSLLLQLVHWHQQRQLQLFRPRIQDDHHLVFRVEFTAIELPYPWQLGGYGYRQRRVFRKEHLFLLLSTLSLMMEMEMEVAVTITTLVGIVVHHRESPE